ncbi:J domain-containing protein [Burkholderia sp. 22PA0099]|uniref:J domain-containing protein n=1 Tax=Burkholderia sp. 22PA0099 TaxID=3237372 RepID=UPI0039C1BDBF
MTDASSSAILLVPATGSAGLSASQRQFNALTRQVAARRERLRAWETVWPAFQQRYVDEWVPLARDVTARETELVRQLDVAFDMKGLTRAERALVAELIVHFVRPLLGGETDRELRAIVARHRFPGQAEGEARSGGSSRRARSRSRDRAASAPDADAPAAEPEAESEEAMMARIQAELDEQEARANAHAEARQARQSERAERQRAARRKVESADEEAASGQGGERPQADEDEAAAAASGVPDLPPAQVSRSLRDLYRRLASALHPDREPDPVERERKTALMQRLNRAYDKQDLLQLLELERDLGPADAERLAGAGDDLLQHYNGMLKAQLGSLDRELHRVENDFRHGYGIGASTVLSPENALRTLGDDIAALQRAQAELAGDLLAFRDIGALKGWLDGFVG